MVIHNASSAHEFVGDWLRNGTPTRARRAIASALGSQRGCLRYDISKGRASAPDTAAAVAVLEAGLAEATQREADRDARWHWTAVCAQWAHIGGAAGRADRYPTRT